MVGCKARHHRTVGHARSGAIPQIADKTIFYPETAYFKSLSRDDLRLFRAQCGFTGPGVIIYGMRILVTGASGFAGSQLIPRLLADGHAVRALARDPRGSIAENLPGSIVFVTD